MNWAAIGAIGEVLGAVAVVATLLYVARQLDEQGRALTTSVRDSAFQQLQEWNYQVMADPGLSHLFQRGAASDDWSGFSPEERSRLIHVLYSFFKTFENIYVHTAEGSVPAEVWDRNCQVFFAYASERSQGRPGRAVRGYPRGHGRTHDADRSANDQRRFRDHLTSRNSAAAAVRSPASVASCPQCLRGQQQFLVMKRAV
jgi:hypothetical protein